jgi:putative component of membrane protein insertase Oxa1/YidC/SpoIIIJ protein YidD
MLDALRIHGPVIGFGMGINRILRCRPGGTHGFDPVPLFRFKRYRPWSKDILRSKKGNRLKQ